MSGSRYQPRPLKHGDPETCTCPHCWTVFPYEDVLYVARHPELSGDPYLGPDAPSRFKPTRFTAEGQAIDPGGYPCLEMACPNCHLEVPKSLTEFRSLFFSIVGMSESGKSFFLTSLVWQLRKTMAEQFLMGFTDLEMSLNQKLHSYEETLFFARDPNARVGIPKTEQQGDLYNAIMLDGVQTRLPKPFLFTIKPLRHHPEANNAAKLSRTLVLYDNAGEHFNSGQDTAGEPGTMHMARADCLFFLFDPTQDPRFRAKIIEGLDAAEVAAADPQLDPTSRIRMQANCFSEAARRVRAHTALPGGSKHRRQVVVVVNKFDLWRHLLKMEIDPEPFVRDRRQPVSGLSMGHVEDVSFSVRALLLELCPEVVGSIEDFALNVTYIPVSTIGHSPTRGPGGGLLVQPSKIKPIWVTVPFLYAFARLGLIYRGPRLYPDTTPRATLVGQGNGMLLCVVPPDNQRIQVPAKLAGKLLHNPKTGRPFMVPVPPPDPTGT
jgi:hypothetical protein